MGNHSRDHLRNSVSVDFEPVCPNAPIFLEPLPTSRPHKMSLIEEARRVAAEFDYPAEAVNKGVKEFIRQMGEQDSNVGYGTTC